MSSTTVQPVTRRHRAADPVPDPEPLPGPVVDNHTHLDHLRGGGTASAADAAAGIASAASVNVTRLVQIGCDLDAARWTVEAVEREPSLLGGVALHPTEASRLGAPPEPGAGSDGGPDVAPDDDAGEAGPGWGPEVFDAAFAQIEALAAHPRVRVVGETGLDYHWVGGEAGREAQRESFRRHVDLAKRLGKVLQIHDRDAHDDVIGVLREVGAPERTVFHCFSGDAAMARVCADEGWYLSFAGTVTFRNAGALREALTVVPHDLVMVETDAPYLTPHPHRGAVNASRLLPLTVRATAEVLGLDLETWCERLWRTSHEVYGPW